MLRKVTTSTWTAEISRVIFPKFPYLTRHRNAFEWINLILRRTFALAFEFLVHLRAEFNILY